MATAKEGGATAPTTATATSSYGGEGGAGGKFRRKPFRKPTTPYDRPAIGSSRNSSLLAKLVDPASRLISYGARRFFDSVLRKRLPPPPPTQISESNHVLRDGLPEAVPSEPAGGECSQPIRISDRNAISDLEQLLKQKTFTRSETDYLIELLHSRGEVPLTDNGERNEDTVSNFGIRQNIESGLMEANRGDRHHGLVSPPISNSKVLGDGIASPAELAKAYIGSRPPKLSPTLSNHSRVPREDTRLLTNMRTPSKSVSVSLATKTVVGSGSPDNGYITKPSSFRRSAIYNMSRSPYLKTLKRRSSVLDDQVESVSSIRRVRQKSNLVAHRVPLTDHEGSNSDSMLVSPKQKLPLIDDPRHVQRTEESTDISIPSTSYAIVPYESNDAEVVVRRSGNQENIALKDRSETKAVDLRQKSPLKLASNMARGQDLKSMEDTYTEFPMNIQDDNKFSNTGLLDAHDFIPQEQGKVKENGPVKTSASSDTYYPVINNDFSVSVEASLVRDGTSDHVESGISKPQKRAAFRMSALEDYVDDMDDDLPCNGNASRPLSEGRGQLEAHFTDSKFSPPEKPKILESAIQSELKSPSNLMSSQTNEVSSASSLGEGRNGVITPASEEVTATALPTVPLLPVPASDKPKEINNPHSLFSFSSKVADKFPSESSCRTPESSSSLPDVSAPTGSLLEVVDPGKGGYQKPLAAEDSSRKFDTGAPDLSFTAATSNGNTHQISTAAPVIFTTSVSVSDYVPSGTGSISSATTSSIIFGAAGAPKKSEEPSFKFGTSPNPSAEVSAVTTTIFPAGELSNKASTDSSSGMLGSSSTKFVAFGAPSSGNMTSGLSSSTNIPSANNSLGSLFSSASKSFVPTFGTVSQGTSAQLFSLPSEPSSNSNSGASFVSSLSSSQVFSPIMSFGHSSSASSSDTGTVVPSGGSTSSLSGVNPSAVSNGSASSFTFGVNSSSSSINATGSTGGAAASGFSFGVNSSSSSINATGSTGGASASGFSFGVNSSSSINGTGSTGGAAASGFSFGVNSSSSSINGTGSTGGAAASGFSFGASSSGSAPVTTSFFGGSSSISAVGSTGGTAPSVFSLGLNSAASSSASNAASPFSNGYSGVFKFGGSSSATNSFTSNNTTSNALVASLQAPTSSIFCSSPSTGFSFGASATSSAPKSSTPVVFNSSTAPSLSSPFLFTSAPASVFSSPSPALAQPVFGNPAPGFAASPPGSNYQMSAEDSMAEDPVQSGAPSVPVFGQANISPTPGFVFGSSVPSQPQPNPFQFGGQQNQGVSQNPSMFNASGSVEFNAGGSFSLGSGGGDKSGRKYVKASRSKNRKK